MVRLTVNGHERTIDSPSGPTLLTVLRDDLGLTGAKYGCGEGQCGACTVLVDGAPVRACVVDVAALDGAQVRTIEGLSNGATLHPVQQAFVENRALQCGYCTPGMVLSVLALLAANPQPTAEDARAALAGNICRCGGYPRILDAVAAAARPGTGPRLAAGTGPDPEPGPDPDTVWTVEVAPAGSWGWSSPGGARLTIDDRGRVTVFVGKVDGGQGNRVALTRLVAAELAVPTSVVRLQMGDTGASPVDLGTFGSRSTPDLGPAVRLVAAAAREELVRAAAAGWEVAPATLTVGGGSVHDRTGRTVTYADLVAAGPRRIRADPTPPPPTQPADLDDDALHRLLTAAVTGRKAFPSDRTLPGMLHGRVLRAPAAGATLRAVDTSRARARTDVVVTEQAGFVAVAAPTRAAADRALAGIRAEWDQDPDQPGEADLETYLRTRPVVGTGWSEPAGQDVGDVDSAVADRHFAATYRTAYIAHVPLEPRVALAAVDESSATVWVGTQRPFAVRDEVAGALGLPAEAVRIVVPDFGGGFGGKHSGDVAVEAARLARAAGRPVRVAWTREEEFRWGYLRPAAVIDVRSGVDRDGGLVSWEFTNVNSGAAALGSPYRAAHQRLRYQPAAAPFRQGSYRALAATANTFARECHVDEIAAAVGVDPLEWRLRHLTDPRLADVARAVTDRAGTSAGLACGLEKDARVATVAQVDASGALTRIVTAVDCGAVVDPGGLRNQVVGATIMGIGGALLEAIHFDRGRILNANLSDYRVPRFADVPPIDVIVLDRPDVESAGAGETPIIAVAPAIANAMYRATGRRHRSLPLM